MTAENNSFKPEIVYKNAVTECVSRAKKCDGEIVIVSRDCDYFALGKSVKDAIEEQNLVVSNIALDDDFINEPNVYRKLFEFSKETKLVIAVGNAQIINMARYFATESKIECVCVMTVLTVIGIFTKCPIFLFNGLPTRAECDEPKTIIFDLEFMSKLKKQSFADAYSEVASKLLSIIDYKAETILNGEKADEKSIVKAFNIIKSLSTLDGDGGKSQLAIINAELKLGMLSLSFDNLYGTETTFGWLLSTIKNTSLYESMFYVNMPIIKLYSLFLKFNFTKNTITADYNSRIEMLSDMLKVNQLTLIRDYKVLSLSEINDKRRLLAQNAQLLALLEKGEELCKQLSDSYTFVYKGRQKRANFEFKDLKLGIKLAPYLGGDFLRLINDCGGLECVE